MAKPGIGDVKIEEIRRKEEVEEKEDLYVRVKKVLHFYQQPHEVIKLYGIQKMQTIYV